MRAFAENPLLAHAMRMRYWRDPRPVARVVRVASASAYGGLLLVMLIGVAGAGSVIGAVQIVVYAGLVMVLLFVPIFLAPQIAGDRERGTWDDLMMTPLTTQEVLRGKLLGGMYWAWLLLLSWAPFLLAAVVLPTQVNPALRFEWTTGLSLALLAMMVLVVMTAWAVAGLTLLRSMLSRHTLPAMVQVWVTFGALYAVTGAVAMAAQWLFGSPYARQPLGAWYWGLAAVNPFVFVEASLGEVRYFYSPATSTDVFGGGWEQWGALLVYGAVYGIAGWLCFSILARRMRAMDRRVREGG